MKLIFDTFWHKLFVLTVICRLVITIFFFYIKQKFSYYCKGNYVELVSRFTNHCLYCWHVNYLLGYLTPADEPFVYCDAMFLLQIVWHETVRAVPGSHLGLRAGDACPWDGVPCPLFYLCRLPNRAHQRRHFWNAWRCCFLPTPLSGVTPDTAGRPSPLPRGPPLPPSSAAGSTLDATSGPPAAPAVHASRPAQGRKLLLQRCSHA